eukprot:CAMPEP_0198282020 /NCGR_PEP_ID=MMETSP1449-20131203/1895_1 /TAXON_ID=420275 /ORGANISM="Attheya septentrionalis, Strain CCMP2084" /LENGTH=155 /DNA_ID=CAMNT_0043978089 /DNA_START=161 /DNA_END=628 /DNA_ORIENTATION=-
MEEEKYENKTKWEKLKAFNSAPSSETFPELPEMITCLRLVLGACYGISLGMRGTAGGMGVLFGLNVITFLPIVYMSSFLNVQTDSYASINFAGVPNALALMLLIWIIFFTMAHEEEESLLSASLLSEPMEESIIIGDASPIPDASMGTPQDQTEF